MKKRLAALLAAALLLAVGAFALRTCQGRWRSEPGLLTEFFPALSDGGDCRWKTGNYDSFFGPPAPSSAWIKCYIRFSDADVERLLQAYSWSPVDAPYQIEPCPDYPLEGTQWLINGDSSEIMQPKFVGWVYLDQERRTVYVYAEFA